MRDFVLILCWLGVAQSILLGSYFLSSNKGNRNRLFLGLMLLMIGIRVAKSTIYLFEPNPPLIIMNLGFAAHAMLGPLFLFYVTSIDGKALNKLFWIHFTPPAIVLIFSATLTLNGFWYMGGYSALLYYTLIYLFVSWFIAIKHKEIKNKVVYVLLVTISIFQISYFTNYILRLTPYETGAVVHSLLIYGISFLVLKNNNAFTSEKKKKYENVKVSREDLMRYKAKLISVIEEQKPYLDPSFSLSKCATITGIQPYLLSYVFSHEIEQNFLQFINSYRIAEAKKQLVAANKQHLSIAGIAHECGFNTLSSFNAAFKKLVGETPSDYRRKVMA